MALINILNYTFLSIFIVMLIFEMIFKNNKIFLKLGIKVYKIKYILKYNYFKENIGNIFNKDDVRIKVTNEYLCTFETRRTILHPIFNPVIYGYLEIRDSNVIVVFKKPFSYIILIFIIIINILNEIINQEPLSTLIILTIFGGISTIINIFKIFSIKSDIEYFINYGK